MTRGDGRDQRRCGRDQKDRWCDHARGLRSHLRAEKEDPDEDEERGDVAHETMQDLEGGHEAHDEVGRGQQAEAEQEGEDAVGEGERGDRAGDALGGAGVGGRVDAEGGSRALEALREARGLGGDGALGHQEDEVEGRHGLDDKEGVARRG